MSLAAYHDEARESGLVVRGAFHPDQDDAAPEGTGTLILLGPDEPAFWPHFAASPEASDNRPDPLDRWSRRIIGALAARWGGTAQLPSDGPPWPPFLQWARRSGRAFPSPIGLLVHDQAGLLISYRGAIALPRRLPLSAPSTSPCDTCGMQPCTKACPVAALSDGSPYDVPACQRFLRSSEGRDCRERGCLARRACPASQQMHRTDHQAAFHMSAFMENWHDTKGGAA